MTIYIAIDSQQSALTANQNEFVKLYSSKNEEMCQGRTLLIAKLQIKIWAEQVVLGFEDARHNR